MNRVRVILVMIVVVFTANAQDWVARYNGSGNGDDYAKGGIKVDNEGNVYVAGSARHTGTGGDYTVVKYNSSGDLIWVRTYGPYANEPDEVNAMTIDSSGNVYVTGYSRGYPGHAEDCVTIKYNSSGDSVWVARYDGSISNSDEAFAIAVDGQGNVYITGWSSDPTLAYLTVKYDSSGEQQWSARYDEEPGSNYEDKATAIAVDKQGYVYVTGYSKNLFGTHYATIKYNSSGDSIWVRTYQGYPSSGGRDAATAIAVDDSGNVYVTGRSNNYYDASAYITIKYNSAGDTVWVRRYEGTVRTPNNGASALAIDDSGNVYVTGRMIGNGGTFDYTTIKYNSSGDMVWVASHDSTGDDEAYAIAVDGQGNVYVTGRSELWPYSNFDYVTIKYNSSGVEQWFSRYGGGYGDDEPHAIAIDNAGCLYVTGWSAGPGTGFDWATIKYSGTGVAEEGESKFQNAKLEIHPNPFIQTATIKYYLPTKSNVLLSIYDIEGRLVKNVCSGMQESGYHEITARATGRSPLQSGIYFVLLEAGDLNLTKKLILHFK